MTLVVTIISLHTVKADTEDAILKPNEPEKIKKVNKPKKVVKPAPIKKAKPAPKRYKLTVNTVPADATVKITNIKPKYKSGIRLAAGSYNIKVSKAGYETARRTIKIRNQNIVEVIKLRKKEVKPKTQKVQNNPHTVKKSKKESSTIIPPKDDSSVNSPSLLHKKGITRKTHNNPNTIKKSKKESSTITPPKSDFSVTAPSLLHKKGITRKTHPHGLPYPSFNNYLDSGQGEGINDERKFLVVMNQTTHSKLTNKISVKPGDSLFFRAYIANSGYANDPSTTAKNVHLRMSGFFRSKDGSFKTKPRKTINPRFFISASNSKPKLVSDDVHITSSTGEAIRLVYKQDIGCTVDATKGKFKKGRTPLSPTSFFGKGVNVGSITGDNNSPFYVRISLTVISADSPEYDLTINKTVDGKKSVIRSIGDIITYRLDYKNFPSSTALAQYIQVIDDYDEHKIKIIDMPSFCKNNGGILICSTDKTLRPGEQKFMTYKAKIKSNTSGIIKNTVEIKPIIVKGMSYDTDTNNSNDFSSATVTIR